MKNHKRNRKNRNARRNKKKFLSSNASGAPDKVIVRLEVDGNIDNVEDPFNFLPNEILQLIFLKVEVQHLIKVRAVCKRWQTVIESVCKNTKSLALASSKLNQFTVLSEMFFRKLNFRKNEILNLKPASHYYRISLTGEFCAFLVELFPRIEKFAIDPDLDYSSSTSQNCCSLLKKWSASLVALSLPCGYDQSHYNDLCESVNALTKLKWLNMKQSYNMPVNELSSLAPTFVRLEHFCPMFCLDEQRLEMVKHLGFNCSSLWLGLNTISLEEITKLLDRNYQLITNLQHLQFRPFNFGVVSFVCEKLTLLRSLFIERIPPSEFLTIDFIRNINRLPHLANLTIWILNIDLDSLEPQANQVPLLNIQTLSIGRLTSNGLSHQSITKDFDGDRLCRLLATIFPNLESLILNSAKVSLVKSSIEPHLRYFKRLLSFVVEYDKY